MSPQKGQFDSQPSADVTTVPPGGGPDYDLATMNMARVLEAGATGGESAVGATIKRVIGSSPTSQSRAPILDAEQLRLGRLNWFYLHDAYRIGGIEAVREFIHRAYPDQPRGSIVSEPQDPSHEELILQNGPLDREEVAKLDLGKFSGYLASMRVAISEAGVEGYVAVMSDETSRNELAEDLRRILFKSEQESFPFWFGRPT